MMRLRQLLQYRLTGCMKAEAIKVGDLYQVCNTISDIAYAEPDA